MTRFVAYYRVSTARQGATGLGIEAQKVAVAEHVARYGGATVAEFTEVESGRKADRPELAEALAACRRFRATLVVAKLDRLARNARFLLTVVEGSGQGGVTFCDLPELPPGPVGKFILTQFAAVAELEAGLTSVRTKAALQRARERGTRLGNPRLQSGSAEQARAASAVRAERAQTRAEDLAGYVAQMRTAGCTTLDDFAEALNNRGLPSPSGRGRWHRSAVRRLLARLEPAA